MSAIAEAETAVREALCSLEGFELPDEPWSVSSTTGFLMLGLNSKLMPKLAKACGDALGCTVGPMALLEYPTPAELAGHLAELPKSGTKTEASAEAKAAAAKRMTATAAAGAPKQQTLRVLALHGQYVNAQIMQMATTPLVTAARKQGLKLEIVCPNGPLKHTVTDLKGQIPDDPLWSLWGLRDVYRWSEHDDSTGARTLPDGDKAVAHLQSVIKEQGPFDGAIGFSNGAAVLQLAMRSFEAMASGEATIDISDEAVSAAAATEKPPALKFGIFFGPCVPGWPTQKKELYAKPATTPSFIVAGQKDDYCGKVSDPTGVKFGATVAEASRVVRTHTDGHVPFPDTEAEAAALAEELAQFMKDPTAFVADEPARVAAAAAAQEQAKKSEMAAADPALVELLEANELGHLVETLVALTLGQYVEMFQKEDRAGLLSHLKTKGVDKLKDRKTFASLVEEKAE